MEVWATQFTGNKGCYNNNNLNDGENYYAELSTNPDEPNSKKWDFKALGGLKKFHKLKITYKGNSEYATKGDVGRGKIDIVNGEKRLRRIDLHINLAKKLKFNGRDYVTIEDA